MNFSCLAGKSNLTTAPHALSNCQHTSRSLATTAFLALPIPLIISEVNNAQADDSTPKEKSKSLGRLAGAAGLNFLGETYVF